MSVSEPGKIITPWAESGLKNPIPPAANPATGRAGFEQGFSAINMTAKEAGGIPPFGQDFNGIFYEVTNILRYMQAGGRPTFSAAMATAIGGYPKGAVVLGGDGISVYTNIVDSNSSNPNSGGSGWARGDLMLREALRRSYSEAGYDLIGDFSDTGLVVTTVTKVVLWEPTGIAYAYSGALPHAIAAEETPIGNPLWVAKSLDTLRSDLSQPDGVDLVGGAAKQSDLEAIGDGSSTVASINPNIVPILVSVPFATLKSVAILQTGQSLAEGGVGFDATPAMRPLNRTCRQLVGGPVGIDTEVLKTRTKVIHERGVRGTCGTTLADIVASSGVAKTVYFHGQAKGGEPYSTLKKGGSTGVYEKCITQVGSVNAEDSDVEYLGLSVIHGEQDGLNNNPAYEANLGEWISDFNTDIKVMTGQTVDVKMYASQTNSACGYGQVGGITNVNFQTPLQQLAAHKNNPLITLTGPKYQYKYVDQSHISNAAQSLLGEKTGQAIAWQILNGQKWQPLRPLSFALVGAELTITFTGSVLNSPGRKLQFEASAINAIANQGFEYKDDSARTITNVQIVGTNQVKITLSGPAGANPIIAYAYKNGVSGAPAQAAGNGERGALRDDDPTVSKLFGDRLFNYCVTFREVL